MALGLSGRTEIGKDRKVACSERVVRGNGWHRYGCSKDAVVAYVETYLTHGEVEEKVEAGEWEGLTVKVNKTVEAQRVKNFCTIHDPERVAAREEKKDAERRKTYAARETAQRKASEAAERLGASTRRDEWNHDSILVIMSAERANRIADELDALRKAAK